MNQEKTSINEIEILRCRIKILMKNLLSSKTNSFKPSQMQTYYSRDYVQPILVSVREESETNDELNKSCYSHKILDLR